MPENTTKNGESLIAEGTRRLNDIKYGLNRDGLTYLQAGPIANDLRFQQQPSTETYSNAETSYSGTDCLVSIIYNEHVVILGNVETVSYSTHRDKSPVRTLGRTYAKDYTRGQRTIAGSLIFVQFNEAPLYKLYEFFNEKIENTHRFSSPISDEIPPFDMLLTFTNEFGFNSIIRLYGVEIVDEGGTFSINDIYSENVMQFLARDLDPMVADGKAGSFQRLLFEKQAQGKLIDEHYNSMLKYRQQLEQDLSEQQNRMNKLSETATNRTMRTDWNGDRRNARAQEKNENKIQAQAELRLVQLKIDQLIIEITNTNYNINNYEKTKMSWDMNSSLEKDVTSNASHAVQGTPRTNKD